jgi:transposase
MKNKRRKFSAAFKAKIAVEAIKEQFTLSELAQKHELHPNQIALWKKEFLENAESVFERDKQQAEELNDLKNKQEELYTEIGRLKIESDWLKKKLL